MTNSKVTVMGDQAGNVINTSENPEYGYIKVSQKRIVTDETGFARPKVVIALVHGTMSHLKSFGWKVGQEIPGVVYFKEQLTPFQKKNPERDYKVAGRTGIVCKIGEQPIFRKTYWSSNPTSQDVHILDDNGVPMKHTNIDELREAFTKMKLEEESKVDNTEEKLGQTM